MKISELLEADSNFELERQKNNIKSDLDMAEYDLDSAKDLQDKDGITYYKKQVDSLKAKIREIDDKIARLNKDVPTEPDEKIVKLFNTIETECSEFWNAYKATGRFLYRGSSVSVRGNTINLPVHDIKRSGHGKSPRDSSERYRDQFDELLSASGIGALRQNSIFATSDFQHATYFAEGNTPGKVYIIFPIDGQSKYSYTNRSDITIDANISLTWMNDSKIKELHQKLVAIADDSSESERVRLAATLYKSWSMNDLFKNIWQFERSDLVDAKNPPSFNWKDYASVGKFKEEFEPRQTNVDIALDNEYEVCIDGSYHRLDNNLYGQMLKNRLFL
jgi:hypothetical protein